MPVSKSNRVLVIASGSSGNCIFIQSGNAKVLVDVGISCKRVEAGLESIGVNPQDIDAIFVTHEHTDHVSGLPIFQKRYHKAIFATHGTLAGIPNVGELSRDCKIFSIKQSSDLTVNDTEITTFKTDHDASEPIGISVVNTSFKVSLATDLGHVSKTVYENLKDSNVLIFESNYDEKMLIEGRYPRFLKERIMSRHGHLSNVDSSTALLKLNWKGLSRVYLAHISRSNNTHDIVFSNVVKSFAGEGHVPEFIPTHHDRPSPCW
jgi:phosphoribosyl 1,2-cyclic phosphodiesterase